MRREGGYDMSKSRSKSKSAGEIIEKRSYIQAPVVHDPGYPCPHCGERYGHHKSHKYPAGRQRMLCGGCGKPFVVWREG